MKNIYIGDIHGRSIWKDIVTKHSDADNIVFCGDYLDSHDINPVEQLHNLQEILNFKKLQESYPNKKVYLLIGNHDIHYWPGNKDGGITSGYQPTMRYQFEDLFRNNKDDFQMCILIGNRLCTHAGVSGDFLKNNGFWKDYDSEENIPNFLNDMFKFKPNEFLFNSQQDKVKTYANPYGDDVWQTPIWIRPRSLQRSNKVTDLKKNFIQIVGHTQQENIDINGKTTGGRYYYIDTLHVGQYLIDEDGVFGIRYTYT
jgi:predicted MPP superfamily phosphohydrolase